MPKIARLWLLLNILFTLGAYSITYEEWMKPFNISCANHHLCSLGGKSCSCEDQCIDYGNCCFDRISENVPKPKFKCYVFEKAFAYFVRDSCLDDYNDSYIKQKCESPLINDLTTQRFITNYQSKITYRNKYCAICNNDTESHFNELWAIFFKCPGLKETQFQNETFNLPQELAKNISYNSTQKRWELKLFNNLTTQLQSIQCYIQHTPSIYNLQMRKPCSYKIFVSRCPTAWRNDTIRTNCEKGPMARMYRGRWDSYKNVYCAVCNGIAPQTLQCYKSYEDPWESETFKILVDTADDGKTCPEGEQYDSELGRCVHQVVSLKDIINEN